MDFQAVKHLTKYRGAEPCGGGKTNLEFEIYLAAFQLCGLGQLLFKGLVASPVKRR